MRGCSAGRVRSYRHAAFTLLKTKTMARITALRIQKRNADRVNVYLDGKFGFGLAKVLAVGLETDQELDEADIEELKRRDGYEAARRRVMALIGRRPRSVTEVRRYFERAAIPDDLADSVINDLLERGFLDDFKFAQAWIENRLAFRPRSAYALRTELRQRGVDSQVVEKALDGFDERQAAEKAAQDAARRYRGEDRVERIYAYLERRGFPYSMTRSVVRDLGAADEPNESEVIE